ncbi:MAG: hypothetical protein AAF658_18495 [Myxococcota bacterium]
MRRAVFIIAIGIASGCGSEVLDSSDTSLNAAIDGECLNCGLEPTRTPVDREAPFDRVWLTPDELSFYGDSSVDDADDVMDVQVVAIRNTTIIPFRITRVTIVDNPYGAGGSGGGDYFEAPDFLPIDVDARNGYAEIGLGYLGSREQRSAYAFVTTSHPSFPVLVVGLTGKVFSGFGF